MALLQLLQTRAGDHVEVSSVDQRAFASAAIDRTAGSRPLRLSSGELSALSSEAIKSGFQLVDIELADPSRGPLPEVAGEMEADIVIGIRAGDWRRVQRALESFPDDYFIQWIELADRDTDMRIRLSRHGVVSIAAEDESWKSLVTRIEGLISHRPVGMGFVSR